MVGKRCEMVKKGKLGKRKRCRKRRKRCIVRMKKVL